MLKIFITLFYNNVMLIFVFTIKEQGIISSAEDEQ